MTREEQIRQAGIEYTIKNRPMCIGGGAFSKEIDEMNRNYAFEEGAKWADKTMIVRVCNWLKQNEDNYYKYYAWKGDYIKDLDMLIEDLKKAMKE